MSFRLSRLATGVLVVAAVILMAGRAWAVYYGLGPSNDEWKLKYDIEVSAADGDMLTVMFTLADEGRLKPIYSMALIVFSQQTDSRGGRAYDVRAPFEWTVNKDRQRAGRVQIRRDLADRALIRILTLTVDGQRQRSGAAYYDIPLKNFLNKSRAAASTQTPAALAAPASSILN